MSAWLTVVGMGADGPAGLPPTSRAMIDNAELLVGGERHLALVTNGHCETISWAFPLDTIMAKIDANRGRRVVVLATGDPMAYGIGGTLARHFDSDDLTIVPAPGAFSPGRCAARLATRHVYLFDPAWTTAGTVDLPCPAGRASADPQP